MAFGSLADGTRFGFADIEDWLDSIFISFPEPWRVGDLDGKYYGTEIFDARGKNIFSVWLSFGNPSERQRDGMNDEEWREYCCDSHWESETAFHLAKAIVAIRNDMSEKDWVWHEEKPRLLRSLILQLGRWDSSINAEISCGGPLRRLTDDEADWNPLKRPVERANAAQPRNQGEAEGSAGIKGKD